jgi:hypothetical protein
VTRRGRRTPARPFLVPDLLIGEPPVGTPEDIHTVVVENYFEELKRSAR